MTIHPFWELSEKLFGSIVELRVSLIGKKLKIQTVKNLFLLILFSAVAFGCMDASNVESNSNPISHTSFTALLKKHVNEDGMVNYKGFIADSVAFNNYIKLLEDNHPNTKNWSSNERLAYWINAYNAFTIRLIIRNYPVKSIKDLAGSIYKVNTAWDIKFIEIEGEKYDLNNIEHGIIRKDFDEPRIHFALVCAAISCPKLRNEAYEASRLDAQLEDQARHFFNSPLRNIVTPNSPKLSKLMDWYSSDFENAAPSIREYVNKYSTKKISPNAKIGYLDYNWALNEQN